MAIIFEAGDVVNLKGYNVRMVVREVTNDTVKCEWFNRNDEVQTHSFKSSSLIEEHRSRLLD